MGRRKGSGFLETVFKSLFSTGTTVHYDTDWLGRKRKIVTHHDTGKTKTYTHGTGLFGNVTKTKTEKHGRIIEEGRLKENFFWSGATEHSRRTDGTQIERKYRPGFFRDHVTTHIDGQCFKCGGTGLKTLDCKICSGTGSHTGSCRPCNGTGAFHLDAKPCFVCKGSGQVHNSQCRKCNGSGQHKPAMDATCKKCNGSGTYSACCKKCSGQGNFTVNCNKCGGSGQFSRTKFN